MDILNKAKEAPSFNFWLENLPEEDLRYLSSITDDVDADKLKDKDSFEQMVALVLYFSGQESMTEQELMDGFQMLSIDLAMELNVREGKMTKTGNYSLIKSEESARFSITEKGRESVRNMLKDKP